MGKIKNRVNRPENLGQETGFGPREQAFIWCFIAAEKEAIILFVVTMEVAKDADSRRLLGRQPHVVFEEVEFGMNRRVRVAPAAIQINTCQRRPRITNDNTVRVDHWDQLDNIVVQNVLIILVVLR